MTLKVPFKMNSFVMTHGTKGSAKKRGKEKRKSC